MAGVLVGALAAGQASDSVGRRIGCYVTMAILAISSIVCGASTSWQMYAVFRYEKWFDLSKHDSNFGITNNSLKTFF